MSGWLDRLLGGSPTKAATSAVVADLAKEIHRKQAMYTAACDRFQSHHMACPYSRNAGNLKSCTVCMQLHAVVSAARVSLASTTAPPAAMQRLISKKRR